MEVGWVGYMLLGITKIAFLENPIGCICLVLMMNICTCNTFVAILDVKCAM